MKAITCLDTAGVGVGGEGGAGVLSIILGRLSLSGSEAVLDISTPRCDLSKTPQREVDQGEFGGL